MQRRNLLIGMGSLAAGGAATIGTGAFTSVTANRVVDVNVSSDDSAYLGLAGTGGSNSEYVTQDGSSDELKLDLTSSNTTTGGGNGVNPNALTQINDVFKITNQGTQSVDVDLTKSGSNTDEIDFYANDTQGPSNRYDETSGNTTILGDNTVNLGTGDDVYVSIQVDLRGDKLSGGDNILTDVTINGNA